MATTTATRQALLSARLGAVMRRQGLSIRQLALRAGLPLSVVQKLIAGEGRPNLGVDAGTVGGHAHRESGLSGRTNQ